MNESLELISSNKLYKKIFKEVFNKYKKYGKITGSFEIKSSCPEDINVLVNFDEKVILTGKAKIKCSMVEELFNRKLSGDESFIDLMEVVAGEELVTNKEIKAKENKKLENFFAEILKKSKDGLGKEWFENLIDKRLSGYKSVIRKYNECSNESLLKELIKNLVLTINSLSALPYLSDEKENIAVFSARMTMNPHFFDYGCYNGKLLVYGIEFIFSKKRGHSIDELNELYYEAGILKDEISNHTTIFGFRAYDSENSEIAAISSFSEWNEPLEVSISNLLKIDHLKAINNCVYIFENPAVFSKVLRSIGNGASLICTSGQLNLSSYILIDKIKDLNNIYYAGDFDPEGLIIADKIMDRYKEKVKFILYEKSVYEDIKSDNNISKNRLSILNNIKSNELSEIKDALLNEKKSAYQELLIDEYIKIIRDRNNSLKFVISEK